MENKNKRQSSVEDMGHTSSICVCVCERERERERDCYVCSSNFHGSEHWGLDALIRVEESMDALGGVLVIKHKT